MMQRKLKTLSVLCSSVLCMFALCPDDNGNNCTPSSGAIELTAPAGGGTHTVGEAVPIEAKVDKNQVASVVVKVSIDGGLRWYTVNSGTSIAVGDGCVSYTWTIGSEGDANDVPYEASNTMCKIKVHSYDDDQIKDESGTFTVNQ